MIKIKLTIGGTNFFFHVNITDDGYKWECPENPDLADYFERYSELEMQLQADEELNYEPDPFYRTLQKLAKRFDGIIMDYPKYHEEKGKNLVY